MERVQAVERLNSDTVLLRILSERIVREAHPGQFVNVKCCEGLNAYLRRPISICKIDRDKQTFDIVFQIRGAGTELLSSICESDTIDVMGPFGKGFSLMEEDGRIVVLGGGIGIFPLLELLREHPARHKTAILGFRSKELIVLEDAFKEVCSELLIATDDGSFGHKGFSTQLLGRLLETETPDVVYMCGPHIMMKRGVELCRQKGVRTEVSMEQRMGCGIGACLVCACKTKAGDDWEFSHVCKDGPVFDGERVVF